MNIRKKLHEIKIMACAVMCMAVSAGLTGCGGSDRNMKAAEDSITGYFMEGIMTGVTDSIYLPEEEGGVQNQELRVVSAGSDEVIRTISDSDSVAEYIQNSLPVFVQAELHLQSLSGIPDRAVELFRYELWQGEIDGKPGEPDLMLLAYSATLWQDRDGYYLSVELSDGMSSELKDFYKNGRIITALPDTKARYLTELAEEYPRPADPDGAGTGKSEACEELEDMGEELEEEMDEIDYEGVRKVSENQKIEILIPGAAEAVYTITDLHEITDFLISQNAGEWEAVERIPDNAEKVCDIVRYAQERRTTEHKLVEQYRNVVYRTAGGYYIAVILPDNGVTLAEDGKAECYKVPDETGNYLSGFCG